MGGSTSRALSRARAEVTGRGSVPYHTQLHRVTDTRRSRYVRNGWKADTSLLSVAADVGDLSLRRDFEGQAFCLWTPKLRHNNAHACIWPVPKAFRDVRFEHEVVDGQITGHFGDFRFDRRRVRSLAQQGRSAHHCDAALCGSYWTRNFLLRI